MYICIAVNAARTDKITRTFFPSILGKGRPLLRGPDIHAIDKSQVIDENL
ncbi:MAG: hypothetical protein ACLVJO_11790 [[Clostridium] scindens]